MARYAGVAVMFGLMGCGSAGVQPEAVADDPWSAQGTLPPPVGLALAAPVDAVPGGQAVFDVAGANAGEQVIIGWSRELALGGGPCPAPAGGLCVDLASPLEELGRVVTDAQGRGRLTRTIPASATPGLSLHAQAVVIRGAGGVDSVKSNVTATTLRDQPCGTPGTVDCPIPVHGFPFTHTGDTTQGPSDQFDAYSCAPGTDESGPELVYRLILDEPGMLTASLTDGAGVDIDLHVLSAPAEGSCVQRAHEVLGGWLEPGVYYVVADTWVDGAGVPYPGEYTMTLHFLDGQSPCAMDRVDQRMFWSSCDPGVDCYDDGSDRYLRTPAFGPVVEEAHLVTTAESFPYGWPQSLTDGIANHYAVSEAVSGFVTSRSNPWAPQEGSEFGQGSTGAPLPVLDEAWYVNMYWRDRPPKGTRMIVYDPRTGKGVVTSGGYETGPGSNTAIGGAVEEVHLWLGTGHRTDLVMGFAVDQQLPLGPIDCAR